MRKGRAEKQYGLKYLKDRLVDDERNGKLWTYGVEKAVTAIEKSGHNYVKLRDLRDSRIDIAYDAKAGVPLVAVK